MIKTNIVLLNFVFKCRLVNETRAIALVQTRMQANQLASAIDHAGNVTNFPENRASKSSFFFLRLKRDVFFNCCVCHKNSVSGKHPIRESNTSCMFSLKA